MRQVGTCASLRIENACQPLYSNCRGWQGGSNLHNWALAERMSEWVSGGGGAPLINCRSSQCRVYTVWFQGKLERLHVKKIFLATFRIQIKEHFPPSTPKYDLLAGRSVCHVLSLKPPSRFSIHKWSQGKQLLESVNLGVTGGGDWSVESSRKLSPILFFLRWGIWLWSHRRLGGRGWEQEEEEVSPGVVPGRARGQ